MQNIIEGSSRFRDNDMELLETGRFSDAQVKVGDRVWNVHKSIVCQRSGFLNNALSGHGKADKRRVVALPTCTESEAELLLEFIYSGKIESFDKLCHGEYPRVLTIEDCVRLSTMGEVFHVKEMVNYGKTALWHQLTYFKNCLPSIPTVLTLRDRDKFVFNLAFNTAVSEAYGGPGKTCQLLLADFVWVERGWLLHDPMIEKLNTAFPLFGSHVLVTLIKGPQTSFAQADGPLMSAANILATTFGKNDSGSA